MLHRCVGKYGDALVVVNFSTNVDSAREFVVRPCEIMLNAENKLFLRRFLSLRKVTLKICPVHCHADDVCECHEDFCTLNIIILSATS